MQNTSNTMMLEFNTVIVDVVCGNQDARQLAEMLFRDVPLAVDPETEKPRKRYDVLSVGKQPMLSLWHGESQLYFGTSRYLLAYILMGEVLYHCIAANENQHALHAGAVHKEGHGIILPGSSGKGKSTLTAWLCSKGYQYLTDELIFLGDDGTMIPFTRPVNLKTREPIVSDKFAEMNRDKILFSEDGATMIPHRLLNNDYSPEKPVVGSILFPEFRKGATTELKPVSPARSVFLLLQCHVNARNLQSHGVASLSNIARKCQSFSLVYSDFESVEQILTSPFPPVL